MEEQFKPHEDCKPQREQEGDVWCHEHNQLLLHCEARMDGGATEPTKQKTPQQQRFEEILQLPEGFRTIAIVVDPHGNMQFSADRFAVWEMMGIIEFFRTEVRMRASSEIMGGSIEVRRQEEEEEPSGKPH